MTSSELLPRPLSDQKPAVRQGVLVRKIGHEAVVWSELRNVPTHLDPVATVMIDVVDGMATTADLIEDVRAALDIDQYAAQAQVKRILRLFDDAGILTSSTPPAAPLIDARALLPEPNW